MAHSKQSPLSYSGTQMQWASLDKDPLCSVRDSAAKLNVSAFSIRRWVRDGRIRAVRVAGRVKIRQSEVLKLISEVHADGPSMPVLSK